MALGRQVSIEELEDSSGRVTSRLVPHEQAPERGTEDLRAHYSLSNAFPAGHPYRLDANRPVIIRSPVPFTKFRVLVRTAAATVFVGLNRPASSEEGGYDDIVPGGNELVERCDPSDQLSILVTAAPADAIEVFLYAGKPAQPV